MKSIDDYEKWLFGGHEPGTLHVITKDEGPEVTLFLMDAEYDPARITFDFEGCASIHGDGHKWHSFFPDQLRFIAEKAEEAKGVWEGIPEVEVEA